MQRTTVLLLFGGESSEHDVSLSSARNVYAAMDNSKYDIKICYIDRNGKWWLLDNWQDNLMHHGGVQLAVVPGAKSLVTFPGAQVVRVDMLLPILHGENGHEDGALQGLARLAHIPVIGCGVGASAVCWDKVYTKQLLGANGIKVVPYLLHYQGDSVPNFQAIVDELGGIVFVKPSRAGSSIGVSKVRTEDEFISAIQEAHQHSTIALIEQAINGRELEVAVLGNPPNHTESGVGEIIPGEDFYSYQDKYSLDSKAQVISAAKVDADLSNKLRETAHTAYQLLGCRGLARVDFFVSHEGVVYVNELNTLPGFTNISQYPKLWQEKGMKYPELINRIIELAHE